MGYLATCAFYYCLSIDSSIHIVPQPILPIYHLLRPPILLCRLLIVEAPDYLGRDHRNQTGVIPETGVSLEVGMRILDLLLNQVVQALDYWGQYRRMIRTNCSQAPTQDDSGRCHGRHGSVSR